MSGINGLYVASNPTALTAQYNLTRNMSELSNTLTRLSTGLRINSAKDDPAGLIASELLKSDMAGTSQAITNIQRANGMLSTADSAMANINTLLTDIKSLVVGAANTGAMNADQIKANQLQVDATLEAIDQIATSTTYGGQKILDGSMDFSTSACGTSTGGVSNVTVNSANFGTANSITVDVDVKEAGKRGTLIYSGNGVSQRTTIDVTGSTGTKTLTFGAGATNAEMAALINQYSDSTGVQARVEGVAQRGSVILSSAGANNDIVITAKEKGLDAGNYTFKITHGDTEGARIVKEAANGEPGVVEITLLAGQEATMTNFAGLFNITNTDQTQAAVSASITRGTANTSRYFDANSDAVAKDASTGTSLTVDRTNLATNDLHMSQFNGWTIAVDDGIAAAAGTTIDQDNKTVYISSTTEDADVSTALSNAVGSSAAINDLLIRAGGTADTWTNGQKFTFKDGGDAGELVVTYKEGATVGEIQDLINNTANVQATLASGVSRDTKVQNLPINTTYMTGTPGDSKYTSSATAQDVINLINNNLGDMFQAQSLGKDSGTGMVTFMDAGAIYGDTNLDNALRFTGMDSGPIVRMVAGGKDQELSVSIIQPSEADKANGVTTPILQINLATDASGNSITTAKDIADLFDRLGPAATLGVSAEVLYPDGVDPNGGTWMTDNCGNTVYTEGCGATYGLGIVQPTGEQGPCEMLENDIVLLGANQSIVKDNATARILSSSGGTATQAGTSVVPGTVTTDITGLFATATDLETSVLNGITINFTLDETKEGFDENGKTLTIYIPPTAIDSATAANDAALLEVVNGAIKDNWEAIRAVNGATGDPLELTSVSGTDVVTAAGNGSGVLVGGTPATKGNAATDPALMIKAKTKGTDQAGINFAFILDDTKATAGNISVEIMKDANGKETVYVYGADDSMNSETLANLLNGNSTFNKRFEAEGLATAAGAMVAFTTDITSVAGTTTGGLRIESDPLNATVQTATSSGIGMTGQSDSNERLILEATDIGSQNFVKVAVREGSFDTYCPLGLAMCELAGTDAVVTVNGLATTANGNNIELNTADLSLSFTTDGNVGKSSFTINGGGALFQIGPDVVSSQQKRIGISSMMTTAIGGSSGKLFQLKSGGSADLQTSDASRKLADKIVNESISYVANARGRLGAVQKSLLDPMTTVLQDQLVALTEAQGSIANADFAEESSNLTQLQLLIQSGMTTLGIANQLPQYAASLVR